jgi:hypothetical protein
VLFDNSGSSNTPHFHKEVALNLLTKQRHLFITAITLPSLSEPITEGQSAAAKQPIIWYAIRPISTPIYFLSCQAEARCNIKPDRYNIIGNRHIDYSKSSFKPPSVPLAKLSHLTPLQQLRYSKFHLSTYRKTIPAITPITFPSAKSNHQSQTFHSTPPSKPGRRSHYR